MAVNSEVYELQVQVQSGRKPLCTILLPQVEYRAIFNVNEYLCRESNSGMGLTLQEIICFSRIVRLSLFNRPDLKCGFRKEEETIYLTILERQLKGKRHEAACSDGMQ